MIKVILHYLGFLSNNKLRNLGVKDPKLRKYLLDKPICKVLAPWIGKNNIRVYSVYDKLVTIADRDTHLKYFKSDSMPKNFCIIILNLI